ncbi:MAG: hypothetical protein QXI59_00310 [Candidatus Bathyarchaeia archaeon]|nr:hypothetical protein [Candidatus Bathyarchaeota archaeon]
MYRKLYETWRREKFEFEEIQPLDPEFFRELSEYIRKMREELRMLDENTLKCRLLKMELEKAQELASSLLEARLNKIVWNTFTGKSIPQNHLTKMEMQVYRKLLEAYDKYEGLKRRILEGKSGLDEALKDYSEFEKVLVRFKTQIPSIVGVDMKTYGPFEPEDVATLPRENAEALIRKGAAVKIEAST